MKQVLFFLVIVFGESAFGQTNTTVLPPGFENENGNIQHATFSGLVPAYQEIFRNSSVASEWDTPVKITGVAFRVGDGATSSFDAVIPRIEIRLSTTPNAPELMSRFYDANKGADERTVFLRNNVSIFAAAGQEVNPFDVKFQFDTPFVYDPNNGHLLMYIQNSGPTGPGARSLDAHHFGALDANTPVASFGPGILAPDAYGLVAQFQFVAIPEPRELSLLAISSILLLRKFKV